MIDKKWDIRFLKLAREVSTWSKDPSTQTGAVIVDRESHRVVSLGYNGFPAKFPDLYTALNDREQKLAYTIHAEVNAVLQAREPVKGFTLYCYPWPPCSDCAKVLVQAGVSRVIAVEPTPEQKERWGKSFARMDIIFRETNTRFDKVPAEWLEQ
jgi:dCMP deaminase